MWLATVVHKNLEVVGRCCAVAPAPRTTASTSRSHPAPHRGPFSEASPLAQLTPSPSFAAFPSGQLHHRGSASGVRWWAGHRLPSALIPIHGAPSGSCVRSRKPATAPLNRPTQHHLLLRCVACKLAVVCFLPTGGGVSTFLSPLRLVGGRASSRGGGGGHGGHWGMTVSVLSSWECYKPP